MLAGFGVATVLGLAATVASFCLTFNRIPTGSMAPTLIGRHAEARCPSCAYPFFVKAAENDDVGAQAAVECPLCAQEFALTLDPIVQGAGIVANRFGTPGRWDIALHEGNGALYAKRVIGLPGETLEFVGGDLLVDGVMQRKPDDLQAQFWFPVHDAHHMRAGASTWAAVSSAATAWDLSSPATPRWPGGTEASAWLEYARPIVDTFAYNRADGYMRQHAVGDVRVRARATIEDEGELRVALVHDDRTVVASLRAGRVAIEADGATTAQAEVALPAGAPWDLTLTYVDRRASLRVDERTVLVWDDQRPPGELFTSRVRFQVLASSTVTLADLRIDRDLYFGSTSPRASTPLRAPRPSRPPPTS